MCPVPNLRPAEASPLRSAQSSPFYKETKAGWEGAVEAHLEEAEFGLELRCDCLLGSVGGAIV